MLHDHCSPLERPPIGMVGHARIVTESGVRADGSVRTSVTELRSEAPLLLRPTRPKSGQPWDIFASDPVWVCLAAGAAGPVGGDRLTLDVDVGANSSLVLAEISSTVLLPGPHGQRSQMTVDIHVADGGTLIWLPEPVIAARNCLHRSDVRIRLGAGGRLLIREELLLGRHGEAPGEVQQSVRVDRTGAPLYHQQLSIGGTSAWNTPAVVGEHRAVGSILVVEPDWTDHRPPAGALADGAAILPLAGPAAVVTAVAADSLDLRRSLTSGLTLLAQHRSRSPASEEDT